MAIAPLQDFLKLGTEARMNFPGKETGNWMWRMPEDALTDELKPWILDLNYLFRTIKLELLNSKSHHENMCDFFITHDATSHRAEQLSHPVEMPGKSPSG